MAALKPLTAKEEAFLAVYYANGYNVRAAVRQVYGYESPGTDHAIVNKPSVKAAIDAHRAAAAERVGLTADYLLRKVKAIIDFDPRRLANADGSPKALHELDDDTAAAIVGTKLGEYGREFKAADKLAGITLSMKHKGMLVDKVEHSGTVGVAGMAERIRARRDAQSTGGYA